MSRSIKVGDRVVVNGATDFPEFNGLEGEASRLYMDGVWLVEFPNRGDVRRSATLDEAGLVAVLAEVMCPLKTCGKTNDASARACWNCGSRLS